MEVSKVRQSNQPAYPDKSAVLSDPDLLRSLPERWKRNAAACAALAATSAMLLNSCSVPAEKGGKAAVQVPFFERGTGRGGFGCVAVAPPAFLSEAEAFEVINSVAKEEGLSFEANGIQLNGVELPVTTTMPDDDKSVLDTKKDTILLDGASSDKRVAFEYVSTEDIENWEKNTGMKSTYTSYDFIDTAKTLNEGLNKSNSGMAVAVFYDPGYKYGSSEVEQVLKDNKDDYGKMEQKLRELVKNDLRQQVLDFISWLKAQGVI